LAAAERGAGPPLLLLMGLGGSHRSWGEPFLRALERDYSLFALDRVLDSPVISIGFFRWLLLRCETGTTSNPGVTLEQHGQLFGRRLCQRGKF